MGKSQPFFLGKVAKKSACERLRYIGRNFRFFQVFVSSALSPRFNGILYSQKRQQLSTTPPARAAFYMCPQKGRSRAAAYRERLFYIGGNGRFSKVFSFERFCRYSVQLLEPNRRECPKKARRAVLCFVCAIGAICATNATRKECGANSDIVAVHDPLKRKIPRFWGINRKCGRWQLPSKFFGRGRASRKPWSGKHNESCRIS